ncbi:hypothetical protein CACET_c08140 [Clostridium aceticum]|uniref:Uncharacterized protein n=1 Tax=Clostridium aceticum TaxID=84022 RepID=A0A0D8I796_9CLOT|nr:FMN-binding protein [Clostridium aceticum]AKL94323.1 hypothetical protein CACET_c08140 [Clostridium aceticum]KJF26165.1 hypothetical protein TZ02_15080 [Clostridium aceticum]
MKKLSILFIIVMLFALVGCSSSPAATETESNWKDGSYVGTGKGYQSDIEVEVVIEGGKIAKVEIVSAGDTPGISDAAIDAIPEAVLEAQSSEVDVVSNATRTSEGIIQAVEAALKNAEK